MVFLDKVQIQAAREQNLKSPAALQVADLLHEVFVGSAGRFTPALLELVAEYQASEGLRVDGLVGPITAERLKRRGWLVGESCAQLWPSLGLGIDAQVQHYQTLAAAFSVIQLGDTPLLLGLRGVYPFATRTHRMQHARRYDDTFVLLEKGRVPSVFRGATHAYQLNSKQSPDLNADGLGDVGSIRPGVYKLILKGDSPPIFTITTANGDDRLPVVRDLNHDGALSPQEDQASGGAVRGIQVIPGVGAVAIAVLFHPGYDVLQPQKTEPFSSIACQTAPLAELNRLRSAGRKIDYLLVDAAELARRVLARPSAPPDKIV